VLDTESTLTIYREKSTISPGFFDKRIQQQTMVDSVDKILGAFRELRHSVSGLDVVDDAPVHLEISNPSLTLWLQSLSHNRINELPNKPRVFRSTAQTLESDVPVPIPWANPTNEYADALFSNETFIVSFLSYSIRSGDSSYRRRRRNELIDKRADDLSSQGIPSEQQLLITLDNRVTESIAHHLFAYHLRSKGWFVSGDTQYIPPGIRGIPDLIAWRSPFTEQLRERGIVESGALLEELPYRRYMKTSQAESDESYKGIESPKTLVVEVKGSNRSPGEATSQVSKYARSGYFDYSYGGIPDYRQYQSPHPVLTFDEEGFELNESKDTERTAVFDDKQKDWFVKHMDSVAQQALLCNLDAADIRSLLSTPTPETMNGRIRELWNLEPKEVIESVSDM